MVRALSSPPQVAIAVNGALFAADQIRALASLRVQQKLSLPTLCELTFSDPPGPLDAVSRLAPGHSLRVHVTMPAGRALLFNGEITAVEHVYEPAQGATIHVRGYDRLHRLRHRQSVQLHVQVSLRDLISERVADLGLEVVPDTSRPIWDHVLQHRQSDFELIAELAEQCGLYFYLREDVLHLFSLEGIRIGEPIHLALGQSLLEAHVDVNSEAGWKSVSASGWDALSLEVHEQSVQTPRVGRVVPANALADARRVGGSDARLLMSEMLPSEQQAEALAQSELDARAADAVTLWGIAEGNPQLQPGLRVQVSGLADLVSGDYILTSVTHVIDERQGFLSEISTAPPVMRSRAAGVAVAPAVVTRVDDPERRGRVKVAFRTFNNIESDWMCVLLSGAGAGKGLISVPDVDDTVLVLFSQNNPMQGVVLGGVYGMTSLAEDDGVEGGSVKRYTLITRGGQRIRLDDGRNTIRVENSEGSFVELAPGSVKVHSAGKLEIEAPGHAVVIRGQSIDFERV